MPPAEKYRGWKHQLAWRLYPRWLVRKLGDRLGTGLMIEAVKRLYIEPGTPVRGRRVVKAQEKRTFRIRSEKIRK